MITCSDNTVKRYYGTYDSFRSNLLIGGKGSKEIAAALTRLAMTDPSPCPLPRERERWIGHLASFNQPTRLAMREKAYGWSRVVEWRAVNERGNLPAAEESLGRNHS